MTQPLPQANIEFIVTAILATSLQSENFAKNGFYKEIDIK